MPRQRPPNLRDALKSMHDLHFLSFLASWTTPMGFVAGAVQKKVSYKEVAPRQTPLHCNYTENHHRMAQHLWQLSSPNQGMCGDCQVRSVIILTAHLSTETQSSQWHKPECTVWPCQTDQGHQSTCPILPSKTEKKTVPTLGIVLMKEPGYSTGLELTLISC